MPALPDTNQLEWTGVGVVVVLALALVALGWFLARSHARQ